MPILDGTDAVMLSAETATGAYPVKVVSILDEICVAAEKHRGALIPPNHEIATSFERHDKAIAMAASMLPIMCPLRRLWR